MSGWQMEESSCKFVDAVLLLVLFIQLHILLSRKIVCLP